MSVALARIKPTMRGIPVRGALLYTPTAGDRRNYHHNKSWLGIQINNKIIKTMMKNHHHHHNCSSSNGIMLGKVTDGVYVPGSHIGAAAVATAVCDASILVKVMKTKLPLQLPSPCLVMFHNPRSEWL